LELLKRLDAVLVEDRLDDAVLAQLAEVLTPSVFKRLERLIDNFTFVQAREMIADLSKEIDEKKGKSS